MRMSKSAACAAAVAVVVCGSYALRSLVWEYSQSGAPDVGKVLATKDPDTVDLIDRDVPMAELPTLVYGVSSDASFAQKVVDQINLRRAELGLDLLKQSDEVSEAARIRAEEISKNFSHTRPDGRDYKTALDDHDVVYSFTGENIAGGYSSVEDVVQLWMDTDGFRENILNPDYHIAGAGGFDDVESGLYYWCVLFVY